MYIYKGRERETEREREGGREGERERERERERMQCSLPKCAGKFAVLCDTIDMYGSLLTRMGLF
jgi:hypothetical protein